MISCLVALEKNQGIGHKGRLPWPHLPEDMIWFKNKTMNNIVLMGRKTWDSIGQRNLPNRVNIVISRLKVDGCHKTFADPDDAITYCKKVFPDKEIFIIGGSTIYDYYLDIIDRFYITEIDNNFDCDKFFDLTYVKSNFTKVIEHARFNKPVKFSIKEYTK